MQPRVNHHTCAQALGASRALHIPQASLPYLKWDAVYHHDNRSSKFVVHPSSDTLDVAEGSEAKSTLTADNGPNYQE